MVSERLRKLARLARLSADHESQRVAEARQACERELARRAQLEERLTAPVVDAEPGALAMQGRWVEATAQAIQGSVAKSKGLEKAAEDARAAAARAHGRKLATERAHGAALTEARERRLEQDAQALDNLTLLRRPPRNR